MGDATIRNLTSHRPLTKMTSLLSNNRSSQGFLDSWNATSSHDVTTSFPADDVTWCWFNSTINATICDVSNQDNLSLVMTTLSPDPPPPEDSLWLTVFLGILAAVVSIVTILGNVTVLLAFGLERSIRQPTNYFIASLAVSDLLIGTFSMPLFTQYLLLHYWPLGPWLCDLWLSLDWTVCLTSQYTVFFITMDRFLSVKIPAKYRNWRTERKVRVMVGITWVVPALIFFTTIIGWQYFVGERTVQPKSCEVQFMSDPLFTFLLTIGYYWITLVVMCILYGGIYKVALELQRKSDAKQRKLESTMKLTAEHSAAKATVSNSSDSDKPKRSYFRKQRQKKKSMKEGDTADSSTGASPAEPNNVARSPQILNTPMSFTGRNNLGTGDIPRQDSLGEGSMFTDVGENKDEDRSSSPAFASDDEGSSSGATPGGKSPKGSSFPSSRNGRKSIKSLNPKAGIAGIVNTAMLTTPESFQRSLIDSHPLPLPSVIMDRPPAYSQVCPQGENMGIPMPPSGQCVKSTVGGPNYSRLDTTLDSSVEMETELDADDPSHAYQGGGLETTVEEDVLKGCPYIDEKSFLALTSGDNTTLVSVCPVEENKVKQSGNHDKDSPLWKRRNSLPLPPLASDIFDIVLDDDFTDCGITEITMSTALTSPKLNGGEDVPGGEDTDHPTDGEGSCVPLNQTRKTAGGHNQKFMEFRRARKGDGRLHSFVKSVRSRNSRRRNRRERKSKSENRARKALRTITIILGAFVLCWTPYHIMLFVIAMCEGYSCINFGFYNFTYWLCYLNSPINPFCYAFANAQFKRTFLRILRFDWHRT